MDLIGGIGGQSSSIYSNFYPVNFEISVYT